MQILFIEIISLALTIICIWGVFYALIALIWIYTLGTFFVYARATVFLSNTTCLTLFLAVVAILILIVLLCVTVVKAGVFRAYGAPGFAAAGSEWWERLSAYLKEAYLVDETSVVVVMDLGGSCKNVLEFAWVDYQIWKCKRTGLKSSVVKIQSALVGQIIPKNTHS